MQAPCMKCQNCGCGSYHDQCEAYRNFKMELKKLYTERILKNDAEADQTERMYHMKKARNSNGIGRTHRK